MKKTNPIHLLYPILIVLIGFVAHFKVLDNGYTKLDDDTIIIDNWENLHKLSYVKEAFQEDIFRGPRGTYYRPIQVLTYMLDIWVFDPQIDNPSPFLLTNLLLFLINGILLFYFLKDFGCSNQLSFSGVVLLIVHPTIVPAVAWVPGKIELYLFLFTLLSVWSIKRYLLTGNKIMLVMHYITYTLALLNKETAIVIPAIIFLLYIYFNYNEKPFSPKSFQYWKNGFVKFAKEQIWIIIFSTIITISYLIIRSNVLIGEQNMLAHIYYQSKDLPIHLIILSGSIFLPHRLAVFHDPHWSYIIIPFVVVSVVYYFITDKIKDLKTFYFGGIWFVAFLVPSNMTENIIYHRMFIALIGIVFMIRSIEWHTIVPNKTIRIVGLALYFSFLIFQGQIFHQAYHTDHSFWNNAFKYAPEDKSTSRGMAYLYHTENKLDSALYFYKKVLAIDSTAIRPRIGIALIHHEQGNDSLADYYIFEELKYNPDTAYVYDYYGEILLERKDTSIAIYWFEKACEYSDQIKYREKLNKYKSKNGVKPF